MTFKIICIICMINLAIFMTNPFKLMTNIAIFKINPVLFMTSIVKYYPYQVKIKKEKKKRKRRKKRSYFREKIFGHILDQSCHIREKFIDK